MSGLDRRDASKDGRNYNAVIGSLGVGYRHREPVEWLQVPNLPKMRF
jgi:hypothetical protein